MDCISIKEKSYYPLIKNVTKKIDDFPKNECTLLLFQIFYDTVKNRNNTGTLIENLSLFKMFFNFLHKNSKVDFEKFKKLFRRTIRKLPLEIYWWLHDNNIVPLGEYIKDMTSREIVELIINLSKSDRYEEYYSDKTIAADIFVILMCGAYTPQYYVWRVNFCFEWYQKCQTVLKELIEGCIRNITLKENLYFLENQKLLAQEAAFSMLYKLFFYNMLKSLMTNQVDFWDINSAYCYQYILTTKEMTDRENSLFNLIFRYKDIHDVVSILENSDEKINFKYAMFALGVCIRSKLQDEKKLQEIVTNYLNETFKSGGKLRCFMKAFLFARQPSFESENFENYQNWYSKMFGNKAVYKTSTNPTVFTYFMECLGKLIPYEPACMLQIHLRLSIRAPPKCNSLIFDYKRLCTSRLTEMQTFPNIKLDNTRIIPVMHIYEECFRLNTVTSSLKYIIEKKYDEYKENFLPQLHRSEKMFTTVKEALITQGIIKENSLNFINKPTDNTIYIIDEDDSYDFI